MEFYPSLGKSYRIKFQLDIHYGNIILGFTKIGCENYVMSQPDVTECYIIVKQ